MSNMSHKMTSTKADADKKSQPQRLPYLKPSNAANPHLSHVKVVSSPTGSTKPKSSTQQQRPAASINPATPTSGAGSPKSKPGSMLGQALRTPSKLRPIILAVSVASITALGALYGAGLKIEQEAKHEKGILIVEGPDERVRRLEDAKARLVGAKEELESKIAEVRAKSIAKKGTEPEP